MLQAVKDYLKITWDDEDGSLQTIIERGKHTSTIWLALSSTWRCWAPRSLLSTTAATFTTMLASISRRISPRSCSDCNCRWG